MDTLRYRVGAVLAFFVSAALIGVNLTDCIGHVMAIFLAVTMFIGSIYYRSARCARAGVVVHPDSEGAFAKGLRGLTVILVVALALFPGLIPWVFWLGLIHVALAMALYN